MPAGRLHVGACSFCKLKSYESSCSFIWRWCQLLPAHLIQIRISLCFVPKYPLSTPLNRIWKSYWHRAHGPLVPVQQTMGHSVGLRVVMHISICKIRAFVFYWFGLLVNSVHCLWAMVTGYILGYLHELLCYTLIFFSFFGCLIAHLLCMYLLRKSHWVKECSFAQEFSVPVTWDLLAMMWFFFFFAKQAFSYIKQYSVSHVTGKTFENAFQFLKHP